MQIENIVALLDQEIARLQQVRAILAEVEPDKQAGRIRTAAKKQTAVAKTPQKRAMTPEGRARIAAAQKARWAAQKKAQGASKKAAK